MINVFSGSENATVNAAPPLTAAAVRRVAETAVFPVWLKTPVLRQFVSYFFSLSFFVSFNVLRTARVERLFVVTLFNCQDCRKDAGGSSGVQAVVPVEILAH